VHDSRDIRRDLVRRRCSASLSEAMLNAVQRPTRLSIRCRS